MKKSNKGFVALLPLVVFLGIYLVGSLVAGDFYKIPITVAGMIASVVAVLMLRGMTLTERVDEACRLFDIRLLDHIVIARGDHYSFRGQGELK